MTSRTENRKQILQRRTKERKRSVNTSGGIMSWVPLGRDCLLHEAPRWYRMNCSAPRPSFLRSPLLELMSHPRAQPCAFPSQPLRCELATQEDSKQVLVFDFPQFSLFFKSFLNRIKNQQCILFSVTRWVLVTKRPFCP